MSKENYFAMLDRSEEQVRNGNYIELKTSDDIKEFFKNL
jgi:hypothetical protein